MLGATRAARSAYRRKDCDLKIDRIEADVERLIVRRIRSRDRRRCPRGCIVAQAGLPIAWRRQIQQDASSRSLEALSTA
jgi:hypothetical protein